MAQIWGTANSKTIRSLARRQIRILVGIGVACIGMSSALVGPALPFESEPSPDAGIAAPSGGQAGAQAEERLTALADELTRGLAIAQSRLEELSRLTKELRDARDSALMQAEDRRKALEQVTSISHALSEQLAGERQEASQTKAALAAQLENLQSAEAEVASLRGKFKDSEARLADASEKHARAEAKLVALEDRSSEAEQQLTDLKAEISAVNEQLKAKDEALEDLASLRTERDELRNRLAEIQVKLVREEEETDRLSAELAVFRTAAETATALARQHLLALESEIRALNEATNASQPEPEALREPQAESGLTATSDLTDLGAPSAPSAQGVGDPKPSKEVGTFGYQIITPAQAEEKGSDSSLQIRLMENLTKEREQLEDWIKELDDHSGGVRR